MGRPTNEERAARLLREQAPEVRGDRGASEDAMRTQDDGLTSQEFEKVLNEEFDQTALPRPPAMPGWHLCWLTTTSSYDTLPKRQRLGYMPVRLSEMSGFDPSNGQSLSGFSDFVTCNEMVLFKIREERYQQMMLHFHHKRPLHEEAGIIDAIKQANEQQDSSGARVGNVEGTGISDMEESVRRGESITPTFST